MQRALLMPFTMPRRQGVLNLIILKLLSFCNATGLRLVVFDIMITSGLLQVFKVKFAVESVSLAWKSTVKLLRCITKILTRYWIYYELPSWLTFVILKLLIIRSG